jgi:hypothetical protein
MIRPQPDGRTFWELEPGSWSIRVQGATGDISEPVTVE